MPKTDARLTALLMLSPQLFSPALFLAGALPLLACVKESDISEAPDTRELRALFVEPMGAITVDNLDDVIVALLSMEASQGDFGDVRFMESLLPEIEDVLEPGAALNVAKLELELSAQLELTISCDAPSKDGGSLDVRLIFMKNALVPTLWGEAHDCRQAIEDIEGAEDIEVSVLRYDGVFLVSLDKSEAFEFDPDYWTFSFEGTQKIDGSTYPLRIELERRGNRFRLPVALEDGSWILVGWDTDSQDITIEDTLGSYLCTPEKFECLTDDHPLGSFKL